MRVGHVRWLCVYCENCVCLAHWLPFSTQLPLQLLTTPKQLGQIQFYFKCHLYAEDPRLSAVDVFEPTTSWSTICVLAIEHHRYLTILKAFQAMKSVLILKLVEDHFPFYHLSTFLNPICLYAIQHSWLATLLIRNCCAERAWGNQIRKWRFWSTASDDRLDDHCIKEIYFEEHSYIGRMTVR